MLFHPPPLLRLRLRLNLTKFTRKMTSPPSQSTPAPTMPTFEKTALPDFSVQNPLGAGNYISTAACLIIGDEVLNGKTKDTNSHYFAQYCFNLGIHLECIQVIPDDERTIIEAARRLTAKYDFVVSSGGIGPTPDDITYESMAKAFCADSNAELVYHQETLRRMEENLKSRNVSLEGVTPEMVIARKRMGLFPVENCEVIFPTENLWVPIVRMANKLAILPGVPRLFEALLDAFTPYLPLDPHRKTPFRVLIHTTLPESHITPFLVKLTNEATQLGVKVGSYPKWNNGVDVSLIGDEWEVLQRLIPGVEEAVKGKVIEAGQLGKFPDQQQKQHKI